MPTMTTIPTETAVFRLGLTKLFKQQLPTAKRQFEDWLYASKDGDWTAEYKGITNFGSVMQKDEGGQFPLDAPRHLAAKEYTSLSYGQGTIITYEAQKKQMYAAYKNLPSRMIGGAHNTMNALAYAIPNNGFSTADTRYTTYRGEALFSTTHTLERGGTGVNSPTTATAFGYLALQEMWSDFMQLQDEDNLFIEDLRPKTVMVHPTLHWWALTILTADRVPGSDTWDRVVNVKGLQALTSPYLASATAWFGWCDKRMLYEKQGLCFDDTIAMQQRSSVDPNTWNLFYSLHFSARVQVYGWHGTYGSAG